jgi:hypothetical protein
MAKGIDINSYDDINGYIGAQIIIRSDRLENPAGFDLGGSYDIVLGICNGTEFNRIVKPVIHTNYFK